MRIEDSACSAAGRRTTTTLSADVIRKLTDDISSGRYGPGDRLPTEQDLVQHYGVSRTVIREAVAALRADGLLVTQQGRGAFVSRAAPVLRFQIDSSEIETVRQVIAVMELRVGVEVEAASLACQRRTSEQLDLIWQSHASFERAVKAGGRATDEDLGFHVAVAQASNNDQFARFFEMLGKLVIPRQSIRSGEVGPEVRHDYLVEVAGQHRRIAEAIERSDPVSAQAAMRGHLENGLGRYRALAARMSG